MRRACSPTRCCTTSFSPREALTRLRGEWPQRYELLEAAYPDVDWYALRKFGDVIRHGYDIVDMAIVARNMETIVAAAKAAVQNELALSKIEPEP